MTQEATQRRVQSIAYLMSAPSGGPSRRMFIMGKEFAHSGLDVHALFLRPLEDPAGEGKKLEDLGIQVWACSEGDSIARERELEERVQELAPDLLYCNGSISAAMVGLPMGARLDIPAIFHQGGVVGAHPTYFMSSGLAGIYQELYRMGVTMCVRRCFELADMLAVVSKATIGLLRRWPAVTKRPCVVLHNAIDPHITREPLSPGQEDQLRGELGVKDSYPLIICAAALAPRKGLRFLIEAFALVVHQFPRAHLLLCGDGPEEHQLARQATRLGVHEKVSFLGHRQDIVGLLRIADLFALSSLSDPCPNALLEAMACGLPIIATQAGGIPELVENGRSAILVPPRSGDGLADAICELAQHQEKAQSLGQAARERASTVFHPSVLQDQYLAAFDQAVSAHYAR